MSDPTAAIALLPCPFCGHVGIHIEEGTTFRWRMPVCGACGATSGEVRRQTMGSGTNEEWDAEVVRECFDAWNRRAAPAEGAADRLREALHQLQPLITDPKHGSEPSVYDILVRYYVDGGCKDAGELAARYLDVLCAALAAPAPAQQPATIDDALKAANWPESICAPIPAPVDARAAPQANARRSAKDGDPLPNEVFLICNRNDHTARLRFESEELPGDSLCVQYVAEHIHDAAIDALDNYGKHWMNCISIERCTCGFDAAVRNARQGSESSTKTDGNAGPDSPKGAAAPVVPPREPVAQMEADVGMAGACPYCNHAGYTRIRNHEPGCPCAWTLASPSADAREGK